MSETVVSLLQYSVAASPNETAEKAEQMVREAAADGAQIVCLPELCFTPYFCYEINSAHFSLAISREDPLLQRFGGLAAELGIVLSVPFFEKAAKGLYFNSMIVYDADGSTCGVYRKMHIPDDPGFYEKYYFTPGDGGFKVFKTRYGNLGTLICWDQWFPEAARLTALMGADLLIYPTAIATLEEETEQDRDRFHHAWKTIQQSHAIANGVNVAAINRCGTENGSTFWGRSFISGPFGETLAEGGGGEEIITASVDFDGLEEHRQIWPFFRDRRIDAYHDIEKRFNDTST
ncbi:MAG: carbon-nitrogen hydrolase [Balneolaceae bacterium]